MRLFPRNVRIPPGPPERKLHDDPLPERLDRTGFPGDRATAICVQYDTKLELTDIPAPVRERYNLGERESVVFARIETGAYHDGVVLKDGAIVSLQQIGPGVKVAVEALLETETPVKEPALAQ